MAQRYMKREILISSVIIILAFMILPLPTPVEAQEKPEDRPYLDIVGKLLGIGLQDEGAYEILRKIVSVGPRLTASPGAAAGVEIVRQIMQDLSFDDVHLEPITVNRWVRGDTEKARIIGSTLVGSVPLTICALGGSVGTPELGVTAPVVEVRSFGELKALGEKVRDRIVFFNRPMDRTLVQTFWAYGGAAEQRVRGASEAAKLGALAVLVRSVTLRIDKFPHTGLLTYDPQAPKVPAAAVSTADAEFLSSLLKKEQDVRVHLELSCQNLTPVPSANVVGELRGSDRPDEIILVGGHLDSWDLAVGAHDDGAGCANAVEALRLIKIAGLKPRRTIRAVMFMDEEFGGTGGRFYAADERRKGEKHLAAIELDSGGFLPVAVGGGKPEVFEKLKKWEYVFKPLGITTMRPGGGGVDVAPLAAQGTALLGISPDSQRYFDVHHSGLDVLESVHPRELELNAITLAIYAYILAQEGI
jgi:hypothetical protein